jgi:RND family efflux transporter MFP subunit
MNLLLPFAIALGLTVRGGPDPAPSPLEFDGFTEAYRIVNISSATDGILEKVNVDRGDFVRQGQVIATLESSVELATLVIARARTEMKGEVEEQAARLEYNRGKFEQEERLHTQGILSEDGYKQTRAEKLLSEAGLLRANENLRLADLEVKRAEAALELRTIRSPIDGVVIDRFLSPGELVTKMNQSKIVAIAQIHPLRTEVLLPCELYGKVTTGMKAIVSPEVLPGERFEARVEALPPFIDAASGTFKARLELVNSERNLPPGLKCRVRFLEKIEDPGQAGAIPPKTGD